MAVGRWRWEECPGKRKEKKKKKGEQAIRMTQFSRGTLRGGWWACSWDLPQRIEIFKLVMTMPLFLLLRHPLDPTFLLFSFTCTPATLFSKYCILGTQERQVWMMCSQKPHISLPSQRNNSIMARVAIGALQVSRPLPSYVWKHWQFSQLKLKAVEVSPLIAALGLESPRSERGRAVFCLWRLLSIKELPHATATGVCQPGLLSEHGEGGGQSTYWTGFLFQNATALALVDSGVKVWLPECERDSFFCALDGSCWRGLQEGILGFHCHKLKMAENDWVWGRSRFPEGSMHERWRETLFKMRNVLCRLSQSRAYFLVDVRPMNLCPYSV